LSKESRRANFFSHHFAFHLTCNRLSLSLPIELYHATESTT
jgi:hypothetical protein